MTFALSRTAVLALAFPVVALVACGQVHPDIAVDRCTERARLATGPGGSVGLGVGSGGLSGNAGVTITSDFVLGRDPYIVYDSCFRQLTGAGPTRPLQL